MLGRPGYLAANKVAEDMGVKKWWRPTPEIENCVKTHLERIRPFSLFVLKPECPAGPLDRSHRLACSTLREELLS